METKAIDLLRSIIESPDDDTLRLIYADRIEEDGQSDRAELIRVGVQLARTPRHLGECKVCQCTPDEDGWLNHGKGCYALSEDGGGCEPADENVEWHVLVGKEAKLIDAHPEWLPNWPNLFGGCNWSRGFIESISVPADVWIANHEKLVWNGKEMQCVRCEGEGEITTSHRQDCYSCSGKGTIPRPVPETAHPIRRVEITTSPAEHLRNSPGHWQVRTEWVSRLYPQTMTGSVMVTNEVGKALEEGCKFRWPGITFEFRERPWEVTAPRVVSAVVNGEGNTITYTFDRPVRQGETPIMPSYPETGFNITGQTE